MTVFFFATENLAMVASGPEGLGISIGEPI